MSPVNRLRHNQTLCHLSIDSDTTRLCVTCQWTQTQPDSTSPVNGHRNNQTLCHLSVDSDTTRLYVTCQWTQKQPDSMTFVNRHRNNYTWTPINGHSTICCEAFLWHNKMTPVSYKGWTIPLTGRDITRLNDTRHWHNLTWKYCN